jgi:hypothetical protein
MGGAASLVVFPPEAGLISALEWFFVTNDLFNWYGGERYDKL